MLRTLSVLLMLSAIAIAQPTCSGVNFLAAPRVNLKPTSTTHIDLVRQPDGSYTAFEAADAAPYRVIITTPHFERQLAACLPHPLPAAPFQTTPTTTVSSQLQVS